MSEKAFHGLSVVIPLTHGIGDLVELHRALAPEIERLGLDYEILLLCRRDADLALEQAERLAAEAPEHVRRLRFAESVAEAAMMGAAAGEARGDLILTHPPRFETALPVLRELHRALRGGADVAVAARTRRGARDAERRQSELFNRLISLAAGTRFRDIASGTRLLRREVLAEVPLYGENHRYLPLVAHRAGFRVREIRAEPHPRAALRTVHPLSVYFWRALDLLSVLFIARFTRHPLRLFGALGAAFLAPGALLLLVIGVQRLAGTPLGDRPVLVLATLLVGLGVQAFTIGLLGELILFFHARRLRDYRVAELHGAAAPAEGGREAARSP